MAKLARSLKRVKKASSEDAYEIFIDGDELPWFTTRGKISYMKEEFGYTVFVPIFVTDEVEGLGIPINEQ